MGITLEQLKKYTAGVLKTWFPNKDTLNKFGESEDGNLTYDGNQIKSDMNISQESKNAVIKKTDGLYVKDLSSDLQTLETQASEAATAAASANTKAENAETAASNASTIVDDINTRLDNMISDSDDSPVGTIISFMGKTAPKHYLICDGTVYNISKYPELADFIGIQFGSKNFFGGNGTTTFAVPDLRGEFLRGTGEAERATGSGSEVGKHQNGTRHQNIGTYAAENDGWVAGLSEIGDYSLSPSHNRTDADVIGGNSSGIFFGNVSNRNEVFQNRHTWYTSHPTNTSVLFCIKYCTTFLENIKIDADKENLITKDKVVSTYPITEEDQILSGKKTSELLQSVNTAASNAANTASTANTNATSAKTTANSANTKATKAQTQATQNKADIETINTRLDNMISNSDDSPVGTIISFMGNTAPRHYLACDGAVYNISVYPELATFIQTQFGSKNYFGGDGTATFAVPDLRGEFLRGTGTAARNTGSGAIVGMHQDGTGHINLHGTDTRIAGLGTVMQVVQNPDMYYNNLTTSKNLAQNYRPDVLDEPQFYTARPTNTSVLFCIKYETVFDEKTTILDTNTLKIYKCKDKILIHMNKYRGVSQFKIPQLSTYKFQPGQFGNMLGIVDDNLSIFDCIWALDDSSNAFYTFYKSVSNDNSIVLTDIGNNNAITYNANIVLKLA